MGMIVCPATVIAAPCARVWDVWRNLPYDAAWLGVDLARADPPGLLQPGQTLVFSGAVLGRRLHLTMAIGAISEEEGVIEMRVKLPLGIFNHEHITMAPVPDGACRVQFG